jgi:tripartite-type tricarboxylate transporter receptor subunit TctC
MRSTLYRALAVFGALCASAMPAAAQDYPARPVRMIVPFAPGGSADVYRPLRSRSTCRTALGQSFVIDNRPGGGSVIGTDAVAKSAPDGYTLLLMSNTHTVNESLIPNKPYALMRDFVAWRRSATSDLVLVTKADLAAAHAADLIKAKAKAGRPGGMSYASSGPGTPYHMAGELFKAMAGVSVVHVPYKRQRRRAHRRAGRPGRDDVRRHPDHDRTHPSGQGARRWPPPARHARPCCPTCRRCTRPACPTTRPRIWLGLMAPKGTPPAVVARLNAELAKHDGQRRVRAWAAQGTTPMTMGVDEFGRYLADDIAKWEKVVRVSGAKVE